jgi:hypothetical protein
MKKIVSLAIVIFVATGCSKGYIKFASQYTFRSSDGKPHYENLDYWAAHPYKHDTSDSIPKPLQNNALQDSTVDVFFLHPTSYLDKEKPFGWNAVVDDSVLNAKTDYSSILYQASVFNQAGRIFAPRYRQANIDAYYPTSTEEYTAAVHAFDIAYEDIKTAFEYYFEYYNNGRPIIIASHSQGSTHAKRLLKDFFDGKPLQNKLVVAYVIGMAVEPDYFKAIKPCTSPNQTGCLCSWRTYKEDYKPPFVLKENFVSVVTNPLTWDITQPAAPKEKNTGAVLRDFNKLIPRVTSASIDGGVLWAEKPHFFGSFLLRTKNYHIADYNFYYLNIRENAMNRVKMFWKN